jgi:hypothetical protein
LRIKSELSYADIAIVLIAIIGVFLTICTLFNTYSYGQGELLPPSTFTIIREHEPFPSDLLVVPLNWRNNGARHELVGNISLTLINGNKNVVRKYILSGIYNNISEKIADTPLTFSGDFIIQPHSITQTILVFHIHDWWNDTNGDRNFVFRSGELYDVYTTFYIDKKAESGFLFRMPIYSTVDHMEARTNYSWDSFQLDTSGHPIKWEAKLPNWQIIVGSTMDNTIEFIFYILALFLGVVSWMVLRSRSLFFSWSKCLLLQLKAQKSRLKCWLKEKSS